jgi:N-acetylmuramate 1-kinase
MNSDKEKQKIRHAELQAWFQGILPTLDASFQENNAEVEIKHLSGDASFRRYFISHVGDCSYVLVDAPPVKEDSRTFVQIAEKLHSAGIHVPRVFSTNFEKGFMCLSFLGETLLLEKLDALKQENQFAEVSKVYQEAFQVLLKIQSMREGSDILLPPFDSTTMLGEMGLFREWLCGGVMGLRLTKEDNDLLDDFFEILIESALKQPQVFVHRDYHSRNLMVQADGSLGVLDFQDAVIGPVTYDLVSLIKDCYIIWPKAMIREWALEYAALAHEAGIIESVDKAEFIVSLDMMGLQRHLKAVGIFSRLYLRDGKSGFLADIPRTLAYIKEVLGEYPELETVSKWFEKKIYPMLITRLHAVVKGKESL